MLKALHDKHQSNLLSTSLITRPSLYFTALLLPYIILNANQRAKMGEAWEPSWVVKYFCYSPSWVSATTLHVHVPSQPHQHIHIQASLVPRPRPFFIYWFAFSIMHGCGSVAEQKTGNKNKGGLGTRLHTNIRVLYDHTWLSLSLYISLALPGLTWSSITKSSYLLQGTKSNLQ